MTQRLSMAVGAGARPIATPVVVAAMALVIVSATMLVVAPALPWAVDFRVEVWEPGRDVLGGRDPLRHEGLDGTVYPPAATLGSLLFAIPPYGFAVALWVATLVACVLAAMWICGVRDWRCYAAAYASPPVIVGLTYANLSLVLLLLVAAAYRWRARTLVSGSLLGLAVAAKLFLWPLIFWLLWIRSTKNALVALGTAFLASAFSWVVVGVDLIDDFVAITQRNVDTFFASSTSIAASVATVGASPKVATIAGAFVACGLLVLAWLRRGNELACFTLCLVAALAATPISWAHYYSLLLVPIALASPSLSRAWAYPFVTVPQLSSSFSVAGRLLDCCSGFLFAALVSRHALRTGLPGGNPGGGSAQHYQTDALAASRALTYSYNSGRE